MSATAELASRLADVEREVEAIRRELAELEARRLPPATELASRIAGRKVSDEELREIGRQKRAEFEARFGKLE
jgi:hypothetical protein